MFAIVIVYDTSYLVMENEQPANVSVFGWANVLQFVVSFCR